MDIDIDSQNKVTVGAKIRNRRFQAGLSQDSLVGTRYSKSYLSRVESNQVAPSEDFLHYIAEQLGLSVAELVATDTDESLFLGKNQRVTKSVNFIQDSKEDQELELKNISIALQAKEWDKAQAGLRKLKAEKLYSELEPKYLALNGQYCLEQNDYVGAAEDLKKALELYQDRRVTTLEVERVRNHLGLVYYRQSNFLAAIEQHQRCWRAVKDGKIEDLYFRMQIYYNLANDYYCLNDTEHALQIYKEAANMAREVNNMDKLAGIYWGMGLTYRSKGNLGLAKHYLDRSAATYQDIANLKLVGAVQGILGLVLLDAKEYPEAQEALTTAFKIAEDFDDTLAAARSLVNLAYLNLAKGDLEQAKAQAEQGVAKARVAGDNLVLGQALAQLGDVCLACGSVEDCLTYYEEGLQGLEKTGAKEYLKRFYPRYAQALEKTGRINEALAMYRKMVDSSSRKEPF